MGRGGIERSCGGVVEELWAARRGRNRGQGDLIQLGNFSIKSFPDQGLGSSCLAKMMQLLNVKQVYFEQI